LQPGEANMSRRISKESTHQRLLEAAGELFAEKGYHATSVREICERAGANVAAVNYHFGDKQKLHEAVLLHVFHFAAGKNKFTPQLEDQAPACERLLTWVRTFLVTRLSSEKPVWHRQLMLREGTHPSKSMRALIEKGFRKHFEHMCTLVGEIAGKKSNPELVERCVASIIGQCVYYLVAQNFIPRLYKHVKLSPPGIEEIAAHIVEFSLGGIAAKTKPKIKSKTKIRRKGRS
jgi:TetR/AcrR family transcriptional regulator, regulator of cefoperazone and chloramphenicol sensitivity